MQKEKKIQSMFNNIAHKYDFLNKILSCGIDIYWRKKLISKINPKETKIVLDMATGTGDLAIGLLKKNIKVVAIDFSLAMMKKGQEKMPDINFMGANILSLPFKDKSFDGATIAFGIRNVQDKKKALEEIKRVLKDNGKLLILELSKPKKNLLSFLFLIYFEKILPTIGSFFSKNKFAYSYLFDSVMNFPKAEDFSKSLELAGFKNIQYEKLTMGIVTLFTAEVAT